MLQGISVRDTIRSVACCLLATTSPQQFLGFPGQARKRGLFLYFSDEGIESVNKVTVNLSNYLESLTIRLYTLKDVKGVKIGCENHQNQGNSRQNP